MPYFWRLSNFSNFDPYKKFKKFSKIFPGSKNFKTFCNFELTPPATTYKRPNRKTPLQPQVTAPDRQTDRETQSHYIITD
jgi:hypothetical protein